MKRYALTIVVLFFLISISPVGSLYSSPLTISSNGTVGALSFVSNGLQSSMGSESFCFYNVPPSEWGRLCDLYKDMGVKVVRTSSLTGSLNWVPSKLAPMTYKEALLEYQKLLHARGIKHSTLVLGMDSWSQWDEGRPTGGFKSRVINNVDGLGDRWIEECSNYIRVVQPDIFGVCNEFAGSQTDITLDTYINYVTRCIRAFHRVKPDLICLVMGYPFWDLEPLINAGGIQEPNVVYVIHTYYCNSGNYPASYDDTALAYWNAKTKENLATARGELFNDLDNSGIALAQSRGLKVYLEEVGAGWEVPNQLAYMRDAFEYCKSRNIDFSLWLKPYPGASTATQVFNADFSDLNEVAKLAADYMK